MGGARDQAWALAIALAQFLVGETCRAPGPEGRGVPRGGFASHILEPWSWNAKVSLAP